MAKRKTKRPEAFVNEYPGKRFGVIYATRRYCELASGGDAKRVAVRLREVTPAEEAVLKAAREWARGEIAGASLQRAIERLEAEDE